jgi:hypothetical protein
MVFFVTSSEEAVCCIEFLLQTCFSIVDETLPYWSMQRVDKSMGYIGRISIWIQCNVFIAANNFHLLESADKCNLYVLKKICQDI